MVHKYAARLPRSRLIVIICVGLISIVLAYVLIYKPDQDRKKKLARVRKTKNLLIVMSSALENYREANGIYPKQLGDAMDRIRPEFLSDPEGNSMVRSEFDGKGGWVYDQDTGTLCVNIKGNVSEIIKLAGEAEILNSEPSKWRHSKRAIHAEPGHETEKPGRKLGNDTN